MANSARLASAQRVISQLKTEQAEGERTLETIEATISLSVRRVLHAEAVVLAAKWAEAHRLALILRARLGKTYGVIHGLGGLEGDLQRAISENDAALLDLAEHGAVEGVWTDLVAALTSGQVEAKPDFSGVDKLRQAAALGRDEHAAGIEAIIASMRSLESRAMQ